LAILRLVNISKSYENKARVFSAKVRKVEAVKSVSFSIKQGETLGLVGESGCGKSTLSKLIVKLLQPDSGDIFFKNINITQLKEKKFRSLRRKIQIVFQDPYASLSPRLKVKEIIAEPLSAFNYEKQYILKRIQEIITQVGLNSGHLEAFPHQLSGGQRQRVGIARALTSFPELVILDEPVSSLDLSTQAQILNLLVSLQNIYKLTYLFISHDLSVVRCMSDRVAVMYRGTIVEQAEASQIYEWPVHPYTKKLLLSKCWLRTAQK